MADVKLSNTATIVGNYDAIPTTLVSEAVITEIIAGLTIEKKQTNYRYTRPNINQVSRRYCTSKWSKS